MKAIFIRSLLWSAAALAAPIGWALYVALVPNPNYDPALDNDGDVQGAGLFLLSSPLWLAALVVVVFTVSVAVHRIRGDKV